MKLYLHSLNVNSKDVIRISEIEVDETLNIPFNKIGYLYAELFISKLSYDGYKTIYTCEPLQGMFLTEDPILQKEQIKVLKVECNYREKSSAKSKQVSELIDSIITECKKQGIREETLEQIAKMKSLWKEDK